MGGITCFCLLRAQKGWHGSEFDMVYTNNSADVRATGRFGISIRGSTRHSLVNRATLEILNTPSPPKNMSLQHMLSPKTP